MLAAALAGGSVCAASAAQAPTAWLAPLSASAAGAAAGPAPSIVSGDLIVKFRDATPAGAQLAEVLAGRRSVAAAAPLAASLARELDVPLLLVQVTSGREALLALDRAALTTQLLNRARADGVVARADAAPTGPPASGLPSRELLLRLHLRPGAAAPGAEWAARLGAAGLASPRLEREAGAATWLARFDLDALTLALIAKLQQRPDVEYVQANRLLRPVAPASAPR